MDRLNQLRVRANDGDRAAQRTLDNTFGFPVGTYAMLVDSSNGIKDAAHRGDVESMISLAEIYITGLGINKNLRLAEFWLKAATERGNNRALYELGKFYYTSLGDYERALSYVSAAVRTSTETNEPISGVAPQEVDSILHTLSALAKSSDEADTGPTFDTKIDELRWYFTQLDLSAKQVFIGNLRNNPSEETSSHPKFRKLVNDCIKEYNADVRKHNSEVRLQDLRAYFDGLEHPGKLEFIHKLQENPPEIKNQPKYRSFANKCIATYNADVRLHNLKIMDMMRYPGPRPIPRPAGGARLVADVPAEVPGHNLASAQLDAKVEQLHYYGSSCENCRHSGHRHCGDFSAILPRWREMGYNVCLKWERL